jgi:hypothetical protein
MPPDDPILYVCADRQVPALLTFRARSLVQPTQTLEL